MAEDETLQSLEERVHKLEHKLYPKAISLFVEGRLKVKGRKVKILDSAPAGSRLPPKPQRHNTEASGDIPNNP